MGTYARCVKYFKDHKKTIAGIGFVLTKNDPFTGGDLDGCLDPETGEISENAEKILLDFNTYSEPSPSKTGVRFFCRGGLPGKGVAKNGVELYDTGRFLTITGEGFDDYSEEIEDRQAELSALFKKCGGVPSNGNGSRNPYGWQDEKLDGVEESERHNTALRLAGRWAMKGLSYAEVTKQIIWWNTGNKPPKPELANPDSKELQDIINYVFADKLFGSEAGNPESVIENMNEKHAVIMLGGKCCILNKTFDPVFRRPDITFSSKTDLFNFYANKKIRTAASQNPVSIAKIWWDARNRQQYDGIVFEPGGKAPDGFYNLWRGFSVEPEMGDWSLMQQLIKESIASGVTSRYKYILAWMARIVQDPGGQRPGVAIVMRGRQGIGKGEFAKHYGGLICTHFLQVAQGSQVTGRFNSHLKDCVLLFVDEGFWAGDKQAEGVIRNLVTEPTITVEPKGKDVFKVKNNVNILIASNNQWVVPAGMDERRFFTIDVSDCHKGDYDFFRKLNAQMNNGGREAMLYDLLNRDISEIDLRKFERTDALFDQILESMTLTQSWWYERLSKGVATDLYHFKDAENDWPENVLNDHLYRDFVDFGTKLKRYIPVQDAFVRELNKLLPIVEYERKKTRREKEEETNAGTPYAGAMPEYI